MRRILAAAAAAAVLAGSLALVTGCTSGPPPVSERVQAYYDENSTKKPTLAPATEAPIEKLPVPRPADRPLRFLVAGDSLSQGRFATRENEAYVPLVKETLSKGGAVEMDIIGDSGQTSTEVLPQVTPKNYDVVLVELGTNDAGRDSKTFAVDYPALIERIRNASPGALLLCAGSWQTNYRAGMVDPTIAKVCTDAGGRYVPLNMLYNDAGNRGPDKAPGAFGTGDNFHPNTLGHRRIADALLAQLAL